MSQAADKAVGQRLVTDEASADAADDVTPDDIGVPRSPSGIVELSDDELVRVVGGTRAAM